MSRFPYGLGKLSDGVVPIGVFSASENTLYYFLKENSSLLIMRTVIAGYSYLEAKISPWQASTQFHPIMDSNEHYLVFGGDYLYLMRGSDRSKFKAFQVDFIYGGAQKFKVQPIKASSSYLITASAVDPVTNGFYIFQCDFSSESTCPVTKVVKWTDITEASYNGIFTLNNGRTLAYLNLPILVS